MLKLFVGNIPLPTREKLISKDIDNMTNNYFLSFIPNGILFFIMREVPSVLIYEWKGYQLVFTPCLGHIIIMVINHQDQQLNICGAAKFFKYSYDLVRCFTRCTALKTEITSN